MRYFYLILLVFLFSFSSCRKKNVLIDEPYVLDIPKGFPYPIIPSDNQLTVKRVELGRKLFYDPQLSKDSTISCGSCHLVEQAMADNNVVSIGINGLKGERNVPTLGNIAYHPYLFREGGNPVLERQVFGPIDSPVEMGFNVRGVVDRLSQQLTYQRLAQEAYGRPFDEFVLSRAIASFERILISGNSRYDHWKNGDTMALSLEEKRGKALFFSTRLNCSSCHDGFDFTNYELVNNGSHVNYQDIGLSSLTGLAEDIGKFKVLSLRNVALTAPYMHDGSFTTLNDVLDHYSDGGSSHANQDSRITPLSLSPSEKNDVIAFLNALSDESFINNEEYIE